MKNYGKAILIVAMLLVAFISGCSNEQSSGEEQNSTSLKLKLGHVGPAEADHPWEKYALEFAQQVNEATDGQVSIDTYPASQLGADRVMTESLQQGTLEVGLISTIAMGNFVPELQLWDLPYIFPNDNEIVDEILEGPVGEKLAEAAAKRGLVIIGYWENDWRSMTNSKKPIQTVEDLNNLKMRVVENQPSLDWFARVGSTPTPMAFSELYTALQQGTVDGQDNGAILTYGSKLYEAQKYFTVSKHMYAPLAVVVSANTWEQLSEDVQKTFKELALTIGREQREYSRKTAQEYIQKMKDEGIEVMELTDEQLKGFQDSALATYEELGPKIGQELVDQMLEYRDR